MAMGEIAFFTTENTEFLHRVFRDIIFFVLSVAASVSSVIKATHFISKYPLAKCNIFRLPITE